MMVRAVIVRDPGIEGLGGTCSRCPPRTLHDRQDTAGAEFKPVEFPHCKHYALAELVRSQWSLAALNRPGGLATGKSAPRHLSLHLRISRKTLKPKERVTVHFDLVYSHSSHARSTITDVMAIVER